MEAILTEKKKNLENFIRKSTSPIDNRQSIVVQAVCLAASEVL